MDRGSRSTPSRFILTRKRCFRRFPSKITQKVDHSGEDIQGPINSPEGGNFHTRYPSRMCMWARSGKKLKKSGRTFRSCIIIYSPYQEKDFA
jgi:hypothetical protein